jgi:lipase chaperone LimK
MPHIVMPPWLQVVLAACCVLATAGCGVLAFTTVPAQLRRQIIVLRAEVQEMAVNLEAIGQRWVAYKTELETLAEAIEDNLETVEKKRKRAAASAARVKRADGNEIPLSAEDQRVALQRQARQMGFDV